MARYILTIAGTPYDGNARAAARIRLDSWTRSCSGQGHSLSFTVAGRGPAMPFAPGSVVYLDVANDDGSNQVRRFAGDLPAARPQHGDDGWNFQFTCPSLRRRADYLPLLGPDGSGVAEFNLDRLDPDYLAAQAGQSVYQIVRTTLESAPMRTLLQSVGLGNYNADGTLPNATLAGMAGWSHVPRQPVRLSGQGPLAILDEFIQTHYPLTLSWDEADGTIMWKDMNSFAPQAVALPSDTQVGSDPWHSLDYDVDLSGCYTAFEVRGLDIQLFAARTRYGSAVPNWTAAVQNGTAAGTTPWTIDDYYQPKDSYDQGDVSGLGSTSCTVKSEYPLAKWSDGYWPSVGGEIVFLDPVLGASGTFSESRRITSSTALAAGGTATITWDSTEPLNSSGYTKYRINGKNSPKALVWRDFKLVGLNYPIYPRFPRPIWTNNLSGITQSSYPFAVVQWSGDHSGNPPLFEVNVNVDLDRDNKRAVLAEPAVLKSAAYQVIQQRSPLSQSDGLPIDIIIYVPFNRGSLSARWPASGFTGTAASKYGVQRVKVIPADNWIDAGDLAIYRDLAARRGASFCDAVVSGSIACHGVPASFDPMVLGRAMLGSPLVPGCTSDLDALPLPIRTCTYAFRGGSTLDVDTSIEFSNLKRPYQGDDLPPAFGSGTFGLQSGYGDSFSAGATQGQFLGTADFDYGPKFGQTFDVNTDPTTALDGYKAGGRTSARQQAVDETARQSRAARAPQDDGMTRQQRIDATAARVRTDRARDDAPPAVAQGPAIDPDAPDSPPSRPLTLRERRDRGLADRPEESES